MKFITVFVFATFVLISKLTMAQIDDIEAKIKQILPPDMKIVSIAESPMPGVKIIDLGQQTVFVYTSGNYLLIGEAFDIENQISLLDDVKSKKMKDILSGIDEKEMIIMGNKDSQTYISVWTDVDCGYCRKLHFETVPKLIEAGVQVRYILWPRSGTTNESYDKAVSVYCAEDQVQAMTQAKAGKEIPSKTCDNPVADFYQKGINAGVRGTPTIVLENDKIIPGYVTADVLLSNIENP